jgi:transposase InsO family protein
MVFALQPWQLYLTILAGWINRQQQVVIDYLRTENQVLRETHGTKRILLSDDQRRRLAVKGKILGRKLLAEVGTVFTPDTILRWHRQLVAQKWDHSDERKQQPGRPRVRQVIVDLALRFAKENPTWGYDRIQGALANVGYPISDTTVGNILKAHGIEPAPDRQRSGSWRTFLKAHWDVLAAVDFTTIEVWTKGGLVTFYLLFVMELKTRRVHFVGCTPCPNEPWMRQIARNLTDCDGFLRGKRYVLMDRDGKFCPTFREILASEGAEPLLLPPRSPDLNAYVERFIRSIKSECLSGMIFFGEKSLRRAVHEYLAHYHAERNHQGLDNKLISTVQGAVSSDGSIFCRERLGGMLKYYYREAA